MNLTGNCIKIAETSAAGRVIGKEKEFILTTSFSYLQKDNKSLLNLFCAKDREEMARLSRVSLFGLVFHLPV